MARISEMHYSNTFTASTGVDEFLEVALTTTEQLNPENFTVSFYQADGTVGYELSLDNFVAVSESSLTFDANAKEWVYVISAADYPIFLTDPDGSQSNIYEAYAITNTNTGTVEDFYDIGGGTTNITALDGEAAGATSVNVPTPVGPESTTTSIQFLRPNFDTVVYGAPTPGDSGVVCFASGTLLDTPLGPRPVQELQVGDLVVTQDRGPQPIRWCASSQVAGAGRLAPVEIAAGVLGANAPLLVSPQHMILLEGWAAQLNFAMDEVFVPAVSLVGLASVSRKYTPRVTYHHLLFDHHEVLTAQGVKAESFLPGPMGYEALHSRDLERLFAMFPGLRSEPTAYGRPARPLLKAWQGAALVPAM